MDTETTVAAVVRLPKELFQRLSCLATRTGQSKSFHCQQALAHYLEAMEDLYLAVDRIENPGSERVSMEEAKRILLLDVEK